MLFCVLNSKFAQFERILLGCCLFGLSATHLYISLSSVNFKYSSAESVLKSEKRAAERKPNCEISELVVQKVNASYLSSTEEQIYALRNKTSTLRQRKGRAPPTVRQVTVMLGRGRG